MIRLLDAQAGELVRTLTRLVEELPGSATRELFEEIRSTLAAQLETPNFSNDLMDTVVNIVSDPRARQLSGTALDQLRRALLSPLELAQFRAKQQRSHSCWDCGSPFRNSEVTVYEEGQTFCTGCAEARWISCRDCGEILDVRGVIKTMQRAREKHECSARPLEEPAVTPPRPDGPRLTNTISGRAVSWRDLTATLPNPTATPTPQQPITTTAPPVIRRPQILSSAADLSSAGIVDTEGTEDRG